MRVGSVDGRLLCFGHCRLCFRFVRVSGFLGLGSIRLGGLRLGGLGGVSFGCVVVDLSLGGISLGGVLSLCSTVRRFAVSCCTLGCFAVRRFTLSCFALGCFAVGVVGRLVPLVGGDGG